MQGVVIPGPSLVSAPVEGLHPAQDMTLPAEFTAPFQQPAAAVGATAAVSPTSKSSHSDRHAQGPPVNGTTELAQSNGGDSDTRCQWGGCNRQFETVEELHVSSSPNSSDQLSES